MVINADFSRLVAVNSADLPWVSSPRPGVERRMLARDGGEKGWATSLVRYQPGTSFPTHPHPGGEEILVLSGTFSEEDAHYPAGWYLRNPPGSWHQPSSQEGTLIFVKLGQMLLGDTRKVRLDTHDPALWTLSGTNRVLSLHVCGQEHTSLQQIGPDVPVITSDVEQAELLVLKGEVLMCGHLYEEGSWIRIPAGPLITVITGPAGAALYTRIVLKQEQAG
ncbi:cupin domain-containing protein [Aeromonas hydrophila]|uniref:cupin domain-containing protein n=1 Tax=Aeromonas hydrophila TaxID=644 RepID=UPI003EC860CD